MRKSTLKVWVLVAILAVVYIAVIISVWIVQTRAAVSRLDGLVESGVSAAIENVDWTVEPEVLRIARVLVARFGDCETAKTADLESVRSFLDCGVISVVDTNNVVVASTDPNCVGLDMTSSSETDEFTALNGDESQYVSQYFRRSQKVKGPADGDADAWFKFVGMSFPGGGYIQVGDTYRDFQRRFVGEFDCLFQGWNVGETGYVLLVDRKRGTILSGLVTESSFTPTASRRRWMPPTRCTARNVSPARCGSQSDRPALPRSSRASWTTSNALPTEWSSPMTSRFSRFG